MGKWQLCVSISFKIYFYFMYRDDLPVSMSLSHVCAVPTESRRYLELKLQMIVSCHIGAGT